jgi:hypothetical protein
VLAFCATTTIVALVGCGGLGVNIGSGSGNGSQVVSYIGIETQVAPNIPTVVVNRTILMKSVAYFKSGTFSYVSSTQGTQWGALNHSAGACVGVAYACTAPAAGFTGNIIILMGDCVTPYNFTATQTVCVLGLTLGTAGLTASLQGKTGQVTITVQ